jgi:hypothetical protein
MPLWLPLLQGTNAHLILKAPAAARSGAVGAGSGGVRAAVSWQPGRHWFMAPVSPLLHSVAACTGRRGAFGASARFVSLLGAQGTAPLLDALAGGDGGDFRVLPAGALMMAAAAVVDAAAGGASADGRVLLVGIQLGMQVVHAARAGGCGAPVELSIVLDAAPRRVSVLLASHAGGGALAMDASLARLPAAEAAGAAGAAAGTAPPPAAAWLEALLLRSLNAHGLLPSRPTKAQVARRAGAAAAAGAVEPAVLAACQLEASLALPLLTGDATGLPSSIEGCILAPRGQDAEDGLDLVDPDAPEAAGQLPGRLPVQPQPPVRRSSFWLTASATGAFGGQVRGVAYRPLSELLTVTPPVAASANVLRTLEAPLPEHAGVGTEAGGARVGASWQEAAGAGVRARGIAYRPLAAAREATGGAAPAAAAAAAAQSVQQGTDDQEITYTVVWEAVEVQQQQHQLQQQQQQQQQQHEAQPSSLALAARCMAAADVSQALDAIAALQQACSAHGRPSLRLVTTDSSTGVAAAAPSGYVSSHAGGAAAWAALRAAALEQPDWRLSALDSSSGGSRGTIFSLGRTAEIATDAAAYLYGTTTHGGARFAARLARAAVPSTPSAVRPLAGAALPRRGTYIITGGAGFLGAQVARWLLTVVGVSHVHLISRSGQLPSELSDLIINPATSAQQRQAGMLTASKGDAAAAADVAGAAAALAGATCRLPVLGVLHAAGVLADGLLGGLSAASVRRAVAPKAQGLRLLMRALHGQPLGTTVLFSSVAALLGSPGQANYAAANAALDAAATALQAGGVAALSVQWGAWAGAGMAANDPQTAARAARLGVGMLQPRQALAALEAAVLSHSTRSGVAAPTALAVVPIQWRTFLARLPRQPPAAFFSAVHGRVAAGPTAAADAPPAQWPGQQQRPSAAATAEPAALIAAQVEEAVADAVSTVLGRQVGGRCGIIYDATSMKQT